MSTQTGTVTLNAAFFQEIKQDGEDLRELLSRLRRIFAAICPRVRRATVIHLLGALRDELSLHISLEEAFGYFDDPLQQAPYLCDRAESLRAQHADLLDEVCELHDRAADALRHHASVRQFRRIAARFHAFDERLRKHEAGEIDLLLRASNLDVGVGD